MTIFSVGPRDKADPHAIRPARGREFVIAAGHELAAQAGAEIFEKTGNIFDAAAAATIALGVVEPHLFGLGGEVTGVIHAHGTARVLAGSTVAPRKMTPEAFSRLDMHLIPGDGLLPSSPPAVLHAMVTMVRDFGSASFAKVVAPAVRLASEGFTVDSMLATVIAANATTFRSMWPETADVWLTGDKPAAATTVRQPALATTLSRLGEAGSHDAVQRELKKGFVAQAILRFASEPHPSSAGMHASFLEADDLASFDVGWEQPVAWTDRHGRTILKAGPWTQGPVLLQQLALMEAGGFDTYEPLSDTCLHTTLETLKLAMADREGYYGDPRFTDVPLDDLLAKQYCLARAALVDVERASAPAAGVPKAGVQPWAGVASAGPRGRGDTTHVDVADCHGNAISLTPSGGWFASPVVPELGFPLGTRCQTFWLDAAHPNALHPGKRPRTTLSPTVILKRGRPLYALGTPGGDAQDQIQAQIIHALAHGVAPQDAVDLPTVVSQHTPSSFFPHGFTPLRVDAESRLDAQTLGALAARGHDVVDVGPWEHMRPHVVEIAADGYLTGAVSRRFGTGGVIGI